MNEFFLLSSIYEKVREEENRKESRKKIREIENFFKLLTQ
jgi:hypothetical protein